MATAATVAMLGVAAPSSAAPGDVGEVRTPSKTSTYIVMLEEAPVVAYDGGTAGLAATAPTEGDDIDVDSAATEAYVAHLDAAQDATLAAVGAPASAKLANYTYAANGYAAELTSAQAEALEGLDGVRLVMRDQVYQLQRSAESAAAEPVSRTVNDFLGLSDAEGPYAAGINGENVVVGIIDTGIWPEHPSFADDGTYSPLPEDEFSGTGCDFGNTAFNPNDAPFTCNNKLLAAKQYGNVFHGGNGTGLDPNSYLSARDDDGHGTHTASTAAGNADVAASIYGRDYGLVSGIAPRARVSAYKVCWTDDQGGGGCSGGDLADAIDDAVADGVDVINYSIGSDTPGISLDGVSFLFANDAGVFVSASAGNAGSGAGTVGSPAVLPWLTGVGASTHDVAYTGTVRLNGAGTYEGFTVTPGTAKADLVDARALGNPLCLGTVPFQGNVTGKIVLCERGPNRALKSRAVRDAGGTGMILFNVTPLDEMTDNHYIPSIHVTEDVGLAIRSYIARPGKAKATLSGGSKTIGSGNEMTYFSSRGPNGFTPDIISPDVTAPGLRILAGGTPTPFVGSPGEMFQAIAGTSMSSPHVAGIYALVKQAHPDWTPAMAKSALMTSARQDIFDPSSGEAADPFDFGGGHVVPGGNVGKPGGLYNPGLVYDASAIDYVAYLCEPFPDLVPALLGGATCADLESFGFQITAENLNLASIGVSDVTGAATIGRTVTNVADATITWTASVEAPAGYTADVEPSELTLAPGESGSYTVTFTRTDAGFGEWSFGSLTWNGDGGYAVRSPIALQAAQFSAPDSASGTGADGTGELPVGFGYDGAYTADASGLVAATEAADTVVDDPTNDINQALASGVGVNLVPITIPEGAAVARFGLSDDTVGHPGVDDLDLYLLNGDGEIVGVSGTGTSTEQIDLVQPQAGDYTVVVHGWNADGGSTTYVLSSWLVPVDDGAGTLTVTSAPDAAVSGTTGTVQYAWTGAEAGGHYLGAIVHSGDDGILAITAVSITG